MLVLELTRRKAGIVAVCWKFMSFQENPGKAKRMRSGKGGFLEFERVGKGEGAEGSD